MSDFDIRSADPAGLEALIQVMDQEPFFRDRFDRHQQGRGHLLIAWLDGCPIGDVYLWLEPAEESEIRKHLRRVPLLTNLEIHPDHRQQGYGTSLIEAAEQWLLDHGKTRVALAVEVDNLDAHRLYVHLGYNDWSHGGLVMCDPFPGAPDQEPEKCQVMVKELTQVAYILPHAQFPVTRSVSRDRVALLHD
jgi:GNAT superfamily N-acetyltransferase